MLGVSVGITAGDLLTSVIGVGVWQLAVIVGLAMAAAVSLGAGLLLLSEAGVSATLVATLQGTTAGFPLARLLDVLLGGVEPVRASARHGRRGGAVRPGPPPPARSARRVPRYRPPTGSDRR